MNKISFKESLFLLQKSEFVSLYLGSHFCNVVAVRLVIVVVDVVVVFKMAGIEPEEILLAKLSKLFGGPEHVKTYEALKTDAEKIDFVYHSPIVTELFKLQSQALKKSNQELAGEGKSRVYKPTNQ
jgi:hypothetical protein